MPVKISSKLPAYKHLQRENIAVIDELRAKSQDIRPLKIAILNLMPDKETTETQLLRLLSNTALQLEIELLRTASHEGKNTSKEHLTAFYRTFDQIAGSRYDGMIITGAPVEKLEFESVDYWKELVRIIDYKGVFSKLYICWAAQAALYRLYNINKYEMPSKLSGIFLHSVLNNKSPLTLGFDDSFYAPHSRYTEIRRADLQRAGVDVLASSEEAGVYLAASKDLRHVFVTGHGEYDADTLHKEYTRDLSKGITVKMPDHYYSGGKIPPLSWRGHASLLFSNWINSVYQNTPYNLDDLF